MEPAQGLACHDQALAEVAQRKADGCDRLMRAA
jgi:hypothetical protein